MSESNSGFLHDLGVKTVKFFNYEGIAAVFIVLILVLVYLLFDMWASAEGMAGVSAMDGLFTSGMKARWQQWRTDGMGNLSDLQSDPRGPINVPSTRDSMVGARPGPYFAEPQRVVRRAYRQGDWAPSKDRTQEGFNQGWFGKPSFAPKDRLSQTIEAASLHGR